METGEEDEFELEEEGVEAVEEGVKLDIELMSGPSLIYRVIPMESTTWCRFRSALRRRPHGDDSGGKRQY